MSMVQRALEFFLNRGDHHKYTNTSPHPYCIPESELIQIYYEREAKKAFYQFESQKENTFLQKKGIYPAIYTRYNNLKVNQKAALFPLYTGTHQGETRLCSTILYKFNSQGEESKHFQTGLPRGIAVFSKTKKINRIIFTESPIDALSYHQMNCFDSNLEDTLYVCSCGSLSREIRKDIDYIMKVGNKSAMGISLAFGNEGTGKEISDELAAIAQEKGYSYTVHVPSLAKNWNEELNEKLKKKLKELSNDNIKPSNRQNEANRKKWRIKI